MLTLNTFDFWNFNLYIVILKDSSTVVRACDISADCTVTCHSLKVRCTVNRTTFSTIIRSLLGRFGGGAQPIGRIVLT